MADTVLRFVTHSTHPPFGHRSGLFKVAYKLRGTWPSETPRLEEMAEQLSWFEANLAIPTRFSTSRQPRARETAISWIKSGAIEHVRRLRLLVALVEEIGDVAIEEVRTDRPGYVVFEDGHQIVALPFADTPR
jgi:hypothetical protein